MGRPMFGRPGGSSYCTWTTTFANSYIIHRSQGLHFVYGEFPLCVLGKPLNRKIKPTLRINFMPRPRTVQYTLQPILVLRQKVRWTRWSVWPRLYFPSQNRNLSWCDAIVTPSKNWTFSSGFTPFSSACFSCSFYYCYFLSTLNLLFISLWNFIDSVLDYYYCNWVLSKNMLKTCWNNLFINKKSHPTKGRFIK